VIEHATRVLPEAERLDGNAFWIFLKSTYGAATAPLSLSQYTEQRLLNLLHLSPPRNTPTLSQFFRESVIRPLAEIKATKRMKGQASAPAYAALVDGLVVRHLLNMLAKCPQYNVVFSFTSTGS
jgi:hypothetical protein